MNVEKHVLNGDPKFVRQMDQVANWKDETMESKYNE